MSTPVISADAAQRLNKKVQQLIDPRLFLCCNYEPTLNFTISAEGQYLIAIQDLYKFALDSSCIIKNYNKFLYTEQEQVRFRELRNILDCIDMLRSVTDHNQSELNGWLAKKRLDNYSIWIQDCLCKDEPETQEDFSHLHKHLCKMAEKLLAYLDQFIEYLGHLPDSTELVSKWIDSTLQWYCNNTKTEIYKGQLMNAYIANANANGKNYAQLYRSHILYWKINNWVEAAIFHPIDQELESIKSEIRSAKVVLSGEAPLVRVLRAKMPEGWKRLSRLKKMSASKHPCKNGVKIWRRKSVGNP